MRNGRFNITICWENNIPHLRIIIYHLYNAQKVTLWTVLVIIQSDWGESGHLNHQRKNIIGRTVRTVVTIEPLVRSHR